MTKTPRWIDAVRAEALICKTKMPWERGLRRDALIAKRRAREAVEAALAKVRPAA